MPDILTALGKQDGSAGFVECSFHNDGDNAGTDNGKSSTALQLRYTSSLMFKKFHDIWRLRACMTSRTV